MGSSPCLIVTTTCCHEFVRNISAKIGCNPFCYYLMVLNWHCIYTIENIKKTYINFIPCSARTISSFLSNHEVLRQNFEWLEFQIPFKCILVGLMNMIDGMRFWTPIYFYRNKTVLVSPFQRDLNWHLSNIIEMYWFIDTIVTTTFCHEFVRNISAKIGCNPLCYYLILLFLHCRVWNLCMFFLILYRVYAVPIQDH
jgi:hypothetical protein